MLCIDFRSVVSYPSCIYVRQSVRMEQRVSHRTKFHEILWLDALVRGVWLCIVEGLRSYGTRHSLLSQFLYFFCPTGVCILWRLCVYVHIIWLRTDCVCSTVATNYQCSETFLHKSVWVWSVDWIWCDFDRASSLICGNKMPTRCNSGVYCRFYCMLNMFRAPLCP